MKIRKGDNILVIAGKDRGKTGLVEKVMPKEGKIVVSGLNLAKHHLKPSRKNPHGGILDISMPIQQSNAMVVCPHCGKPTRIAHTVNSEIKERICRKCKGNLNLVSSAKVTVKEKNVKA